VVVRRGVFGGASIDGLSTLKASPRSAALALRRLTPLARLEKRARRLELRSGPDSRRARRLRVHVLERLDPTFDVGGVDSAELPQLARRRLWQEAEPIRRLLWTSLALLAGVCVVVALVIGAACAVSPVVRAHFFPPNLAAHAAWQLSSTFPGMPGSGIGPSGPSPLFFHTLDENNASITIKLPRPARVRSVRIVNREDCCRERALPLNVSALSPEGEQLLCQRRAPFRSWTCQPNTPVRTDTVRVRHPGQGILHLASIEVYE